MVNITTVNTLSLSHNPSPCKMWAPTPPSIHPLLSSIPAGQMVSALHSGHHWAERLKPHCQDETFHPTDPSPPTHPLMLPFLSLCSSFLYLRDCHSVGAVYADKLLTSGKNLIIASQGQQFCSCTSVSCQEQQQKELHMLLFHTHINTAVTRQ